MKDQSLLVDIDASCGVDCEGKAKVLVEPSAEVVQPAEACAELGAQRSPGDRARCGQAMQPIGEPSVDVQSLRVVGNRPNGGFFERYGMLLQLCIEAF